MLNDHNTPPNLLQDNHLSLSSIYDNEIIINNIKKSFNALSDKEYISCFHIDLSSNLLANSVLRFNDCSSLQSFSKSILSNYSDKHNGHCVQVYPYQFVVLIGSNTPINYIHTAKTLLDLLSRSLLVKNNAIYISSHIGIANYPEHTCDLNTLLHNAYTALVNANNKKSEISVFNSTLNNASKRYFSIIDNLSSELAISPSDSSLNLAYQPKIDLNNGNVTGYEALLRWQNHNLGNIAPSELIPLIENTKLIHPFTYHVIVKAFQDMAHWISQGHYVSVAVNISANNFEHPQFLHFIKNKLIDYGIPPNYLELEITETSLINQPKLFKDTLHQLNKMGIKLSIDDFGTGYSSLSYLAMLPVDYLKIDGSFIKHIDRDKSYKIVKSIIDMGSNLDLQVIAEGVEHAKSLEVLKSLNCHMAQGFYIGMPMPPDKVTDTLCIKE